tara:strand:+ start:2182 stop:2406 length:225 start_codon:yes stop_codon:yes gene_type:complete
MKEKTLIEMKNKIETLGLINQKLISELNQTATIALGTLETLKHMPGYDEAILKLKDQASEERQDKPVEDKKLEL